VTNAVHDRTEWLQQVLEEQFEAYTRHLTQMILSGRGGQVGPDADGDAARARSASSRQALTDIAHALRRMAEGTYGTCERCARAIPVERLEVMPQVRYCKPCQPDRCG
jgi:RNA polymerase-binding transcription factor DksA